jgi:hypothetical protein
MPEHTQLRERRLSPRRNTRIAAKVVYNGGRGQIPCVIRDLSEGGAKIEVQSVRDVPPTIDLIVPGARPHSCRVVWRALKEIGVAFT